LKAAKWYGLRDIRIEDVENPSMDPDQVLIKVKYAGICGSDFHVWTGEFPAWFNPPKIMGHEFSGEIVDVGKRVPETAGLSVGDRVTVDPTMNCGTCYYCRTGHPKECMNLKTIGWTYQPGAMAEYVNVRYDFVYKLPNELSFEEGALTEPISCAYHSFENAGIEPGYSVAILGAGTIGLSLLQLAKAAGASKIIVSDIDDAALNLAKKLGADIALNPKEVDIAKEVNDLTDGFGVDVCFEAVGIPETIEQAIKLVKIGGRAMIMGVPSKDAKITIHPLDLLLKEMTIKATHDNPFTFMKSLQVMRKGLIDLKSMITNILGLDEAQKAFETMEKPGVAKVLLKA
jgi:2-desacetyl-2-hydroxyethyl bacteriochlorophyllide A dehydrogenase